MQSATARLLRMFCVPRASWIFFEPTVNSTATGTTHSTAAAMRASQQNMAAPTTSVDSTEANSWGT